MLLSASASLLAGCNPVARIAEFGGGLLANLPAVRALVPTPPASVQPVARGGSWCDSMERQGWPDRTGIQLRDLGPTVQVPVIAILRYGRAECGWRINLPADVPVS